MKDKVHEEETLLSVSVSDIETLINIVLTEDAKAYFRVKIVARSLMARIKLALKVLLGENLLKPIEFKSTDLSRLKTFIDQVAYSKIFNNASEELKKKILN